MSNVDSLHEASLLLSCLCSSLINDFRFEEKEKIIPHECIIIIIQYEALTSHPLLPPPLVVFLLCLSSFNQIEPVARGD